MILYHSTDISNIKTFRMSSINDEDCGALHGFGVYFYDNKDAANGWGGKYIYTVEVPDKYKDKLCIMDKWNKDSILKYVDYRKESDNNSDKYVGALLPSDSCGLFSDMFFEYVIMSYDAYSDEQIEEVATLFDKYLLGEELDEDDKQSINHYSFSCKYCDNMNYNKCRDVVNNFNIHEVVISNQEVVDNIKILKVEEKSKKI